MNENEVIVLDHVAKVTKQWKNLLSVSVDDSDIRKADFWADGDSIPSDHLQTGDPLWLDVEVDTTDRADISGDPHHRSHWSLTRHVTKPKPFY